MGVVLTDVLSQKNLDRAIWHLNGITGCLEMPFKGWVIIGSLVLYGLEERF